MVSNDINSYSRVEELFDLSRSVSPSLTLIDMCFPYMNRSFIVEPASYRVC